MWLQKTGERADVRCRRMILDMQKARYHVEVFQRDHLRDGRDERWAEKCVTHDGESPEDVD